MQEQKDMMGYLLEKFLEKNPFCEEPEYEQGVRDFVGCARAYLRDNQPVSMDYIEKGFAVRLQDGTVVPFVDDPVEATGGIDGGIELTKPDPKKDKGIDKANSYAFGITGIEEK